MVFSRGCVPSLLPLAPPLAVLLALASTVMAATADDSAKPANKSGKSKPKQEQAQKYVRPADPSLYAGSETCKTCHEDMPTEGFYKAYENSPHFVTTLDTKRGPEWHGCEACHGPGKAHVEGGGDKSKIFSFKEVSAADASARCLDCHESGQEHANFGRSAHLQNNVGCVDCHDPHRPGENEFLLKEKQPTLCYGCHLEIKQQFTRTFHHRVNEGLVQCSDCHNAHGGFQVRQLRATHSQDAPCFKCHADKAGPFVYEHEAVRFEGCTACHAPHGNSNPRLLKRSQVNLLCLECHAFSADQGGPAATPTFHNQAQKYQACTMCHTAIHGSNTNKFFFQP
jgi:DmsE family decaheme c-type cytochrome